MKKDRRKKKKLLEIYKDGDFIYAKAENGITEKDWLAVIGLYKTLVEIIKGENRKWIN